MSTATILNINSQAKRVSEFGEVCPICEEGLLTQRSDMNQFVRNGIFVRTVCFFSTCDNCGSEQANAEQISRNKRECEKAYNLAVINLQSETGNYY